MTVLIYAQVYEWNIKVGSNPKPYGIRTRQVPVANFINALRL